MLSMPISLLIFQVCTEMLLGALLGILGTAYPFRMSSMAKGAPTRPAAYTIVEDVCAVDGGEGVSFRTAFDARYQASAEIRLLLKKMDWLWGVSGLCIAIILLVIIWSLDNPDVGFVLGWLLPWAWAAFMAFFTVRITHTAKAQETSRLFLPSPRQDSC